MVKMIFMAVFEKSKYQLKEGNSPPSVNKKIGALKNSDCEDLDVFSAVGKSDQKTGSTISSKRESKPIADMKNSTAFVPSTTSHFKLTSEEPCNTKNVLRKLTFASTDEVMLCGSILSDSSVQEGGMNSKNVKSRRSSVSDMMISFSNNEPKHRKNYGRCKREKTTALVDVSTTHASNRAPNMSRSEEDVDCLSMITYDHSIGQNSAREIPRYSSVDKDIRDKKDLFDAIAVTKQGKARVSFFGEQSNATSIKVNVHHPPIGRSSSSALTLSNRSFTANYMQPSAKSFSLELNYAGNTTTVRSPFIEKISSILYAN